MYFKYIKRTDISNMGIYSYYEITDDYNLKNKTREELVNDIKIMLGPESIRINTSLSKHDLIKFYTLIISPDDENIWENSLKFYSDDYLIEEYLDIFQTLHDKKIIIVSMLPLLQLIFLLFV